MARPDWPLSKLLAERRLPRTGPPATRSCSKAAIAKGIVDYVLSPEKIAAELNRITEGRKRLMPTQSEGEPKMPEKRFFRDPEAMTYIKESILSRVLEMKGGCDPIRIWVPGCSTGEEVYSIAIILAEVLGERLRDARIQIFGTDLSEKELAKARSGTYSLAELAGVSSGRLQQFLITSTSDGYQIIEPLRDLCIFVRHDVLKDPPFCRIDLIISSNLLSRLDDGPKERVLATFHFALNPSGYLLPGQSETMTGSIEFTRLP